MDRFKLLVVFLSLAIFLSGCKTIQQKTDKIVEEENKKLSKFIGKSSKELKINLGEPDEDYKNVSGNLEFVYKTKKYGIPCERKFEINSNSIVIGFISNGCF
tara:strand:+ start:74 stop:379 length:306 start_codon:yes stop_codon:yes gene_type:complete